MKNKVLPVIIILLLSINCYSQWKWQDSTYRLYDLHCVKMLDANTGWAVGDDGLALRYDPQNSFSKWALENSTTKATIWNISFTDKYHGWAMADSNIVMQYSMNSWTKDKIVTDNILQGNFYLNETNVWAVGSLGTIFHYDGIGWTEQASGTYSFLTSVYFVDETHGWCVGTESTILFYNGTKWIKQAGGKAYSLYSVFFLDATHGWAVGDEGVILKYDGVNWMQENSGTNHWLRSVYFTDENNGWAVGEKGLILHYNGSKWNAQKSPCKSMLLSVSFIDSKHGWAVGEGGKIIYTEDGGLAGIDEEKNNEISKFSIYPNPLSQLSVISYQLSARSHVSLEVYDMMGREVKQLIIDNGQLLMENAGEHRISFNAENLSQGIYFVRLVTDNQSRVLKFEKR